MSYAKRYLYVLVCLGFLIGTFAAQQKSAAQQGGHAGHHGGGADVESSSDSLASNDQDSGKKDGGGGMGGGGMGGGGMGGGGMGGGGMGKGMGGGAPAAELYPHLMSLPELTPEHRAELEAHAHQRMIDGTVLMSGGLDELTAAASVDDYARMQRATSTLREGVTQFETGLATHRALVEGTSPRNEALRWLKQELSLTSPVAEQPGLQLWGMGAFHSLVMLVLVAFAITMLAMYYFKMQRATALLQVLASGNLVGGDSAPGPAPVTTSGSATRPTATRPTATRPAVTRPTPSTDNPDAVMSIETDCCPAGTLLASDKSPQGLLPFVRRKQCNLQVVKITQETPDVKTFRMICCHGGPIPFSYLPGQFLTLTMPVGDKPIRRSYTISSSPTQGYYCEIAVKREDKGQGSRYLHDTVKEGDILEAQAPSGRFTFTGKEGDSVVLIGGGVGITPMMSITRALTDMAWKGQIYFIVAARDPEHFIFRSELKRLEQQNANLHVFAALSRMSEPVDGFYSGRLSKDLLAEWVPEINQKWIHICGAPPMMDSTKEMLAELGVPKENIHLENFGSAQKPKPKSKSTEPPPAQTTAGASDVATATVTFTTSGKSTPLGTDETVLEAAERIDVDVDYSCRVGMCGVCRIKKLSGEVTQESTDGLEPGDEEAGMILACVSRSKGDLSVEE